MKNKILSLTLLATTIFGLGCASVNSVSLTPIPSNRSKVVRAEVSKLIILGFNFDNDFIDGLVGNLKQQCPNGVVSGILTKDEIISYIFAHTHKVSATGYCNVGGTAQTPKGRSTASEVVE